MPNQHTGTPGQFDFRKLADGTWQRRPRGNGRARWQTLTCIELDRPDPSRNDKTPPPPQFQWEWR